MAREAGMARDRTATARAAERERWRALRQLEGWLEKPMMALGIVWLALLFVELTGELGPGLRTAGTAIWIAFLADFALRLLLAPRKLAFLRRNWLVAVSLAVPALRFVRALRFLQVARGARGLRLVRILGSLNRGSAVLRRAMRRRRLGYVLALSVLVVVFGAAGLYALERGAGSGFVSFGAALWWTARMVMTIGPEFWPATPEGRLLSLLVSLYGFATFGYVTAAFASFFVERDAASAGAATAGDAALRALAAEVRALREAAAAGEAKPC
jgi:voltage-gated potassium channel